MTNLPPVDEYAAHHHEQPARKARPHADFSTHLPQQRPVVNLDKQSTSARAASQAATNVVEAPKPPRQGDEMFRDALAPGKAGLILPGLSGRIYPQSLRVVGYLSMLEGVPGAPVTADEISKPGLFASAALPPTPIPTSVLEANGVSMANTGLESQAAPFGKTAPPEASGSNEVANDTQLSDVGLQGQGEWLHQLVRFEGNTATLWIRDFRLNESQKQALATKLRGYARAVGTPIKRVMVNGEVLWREDATTDNNKGAAYGR
jgi:hypothetical protein